MMGYFLVIGLVLLQWGLIAIASTSTETEAEINARKMTDVNLWEGDIKLLPGQRAQIERAGDFSGPQTLVRTLSYYLWPNGVVPYILDSSASGHPATVKAINEAIEEYHNKTCITLVPRTNEANYVRFIKEIGCWSYVGRVHGSQDVSIGENCEHKGVVMHEIFHVLGRFHEHSRPDRDNYINIHSENIKPGAESNFRKEEISSSSFLSLQGISYDYYSIMHYGAYTFSKNDKPTITAKDPNVSTSSIGQRNDFTESDLQHVRILYNCPNASRGGSWGSWSQWRECSMTCNGGSQSRNRTCVGGSDCTGTNIETRACNTQNCTVPATWSAWNPWGGCSATCGGGRQSRTRTCQNGGNCVGPSIEHRDCSTQNCPQSPTWSEWGDWSECSSTCSGGMRSRTRRCINGNSCTGVNVQHQECNTNVSCTPDPSSGPWGEWSACSASCGTGSRSRSRNCSLSQCQTQTEDCNTQKCPNPLEHMSHLGCYSVLTSQSLKLLEGLTPEVSDSAVTRTKPVEKCGLAAVKLGYTVFGLIVGFCVSGSNNTSDYTRFEGYFCEDGKGGSFQGTLFMDVYEIGSPETYSDGEGHYHEEEDDSSMLTTPPATDVPSSSFAAVPGVLCLCLALLAAFAMMNY